MHGQPEHERNQRDNQINVAEEQKKKGKKKTWKKINFSQEILSSSKEPKSKQQVPNYETPPLKQPRVICLGPKAYNGIRDKTPVKWGLEGCGAGEHDEGGTFVVDTSAVEE